MNWLIAYNALSGALWSFAMINVLGTWIVFPQDVFQLTYKWTTGIQCMAIIEIINSATGVVRSPLMTTLMQVASRLLVVLGIWTLLPYAEGNYSYAYLTVHIAWGVTEVVRYYYYALNLVKAVPQWLEYLRYNLFLVLYPLGISSEIYMIYKALPEAYILSPYYSLFLLVALIAYLPGTPILYGHMLRQRSKFMKSLQIPPEKKAQ